MKLPEQWAGWTIEEQIGAGSYGTVYQAACKDQLSAIKVIDIPGSEGERSAIRRDYPDDVAFLHYCEDISKNLLKQIKFFENINDQPNIVRIYDSIAEPDPETLTWHIYIRMELLEALPDYLLHHRMSEEEILQVGVDICHALSYCEDHQIIHRDIKPDNILMSPDGVAKLCDFGTARRVDLLCDTLSLKGSPNYMAPEIYHGEPYDFRADQYSLGLVLYQFLNDHHLPFIDSSKQLITQRDREQALKCRMSGDPLSPPSEASEGAAKVVCKACSYLPDDRYASIHSLENALLWALGAADETSLKDPEQINRTTTGRLIKHRRVVVTSVIVVSALAVTAGAVLSWAYASNKSSGILDLSASEEEQAEVNLNDPIVERDASGSGVQTSTWDCLYFGEYPQTEIVDTAESCGTYGKYWSDESDYEINGELYEQLKEADYDENGDTTIDDVRYRRLTADSEDVSFYYTYEEGDSAELAGEFYTWNSSVPYHYFRYDPIKWRVLDVDNGQALLLADKILDTRSYQTDHNYEAVTWETSDIRSWLNGTSDSENAVNELSAVESFIDTAFSEQQIVAIIEKTVNNENNSLYGTSGGNDTEDLVFLLSENDCQNARYGFSEYTNKSDNGRNAESSTYAKATGVRCSNSGSITDVSSWWLRSPGVDLEPYRAQFASEDGTVVSEGEDTEISDMGVRPALWLDLNDGEWEKAEIVDTVSNADE